MDPLIACLKKSPPAAGQADIRDAAADALVRIGQPAVESLIASLKDSDLSCHRRIADVLVKIGQPAVEALIACLAAKDGDSDVRRQAAETLGRLGDNRAVEVLTACLKDKEISVRREAIEALGKLGDKRAVEPLIALLATKDEESDVRGAPA